MTNSTSHIKPAARSEKIKSPYRTEGQFDVVDLMVNDQFKTLSINLNGQHVNGMTHFDLARFLDILEYLKTF